MVVGLVDFVEICEGDVLCMLVNDLLDVVDLLLFDGVKVLYLEIFVLVELWFRVGVFVVVDNVEYSFDYFVYVCVLENGYLLVLFGGDVELLMWIC